MEQGITLEDLMKKGKENKISSARAAFCYQSHIKELIPLSVIAKYLRTSISPIAILVKKGDPKSRMYQACN